MHADFSLLVRVVFCPPTWAFPVQFHRYKLCMEDTHSPWDRPSRAVDIFCPCYQSTLKCRDRFWRWCGCSGRLMWMLPRPFSLQELPIFTLLVARGECVRC